MYKDIKNKTKSSKIWANYRHRFRGYGRKVLISFIFSFFFVSLSKSIIICETP